MNVSGLMQRVVATVHVSDRLDAVAKLLRDRDCGCVIVVDAERRPLAVVTDRDVALTALRTGKQLAAIGVERRCPSTCTAAGRRTRSPWRNR